jgi:SAM-dependent methyltransferase
MSAIRLHLGCGQRFLPGWLHVDAQAFEHVDYQTTVDKLDMFEDETVDEIYACHVLEHIPRSQILTTLKEWNRVLKPGAKIRIAVPDWDAVVAHCAGNPERLPEVMGLVTGGQRDGFDHHTFMFNFWLLSELLKLCGFVKMRRYPWKAFLPKGYDDYSRCYLPHMDQSGRLMSLNMAARKQSAPYPLSELPFRVAVAVGLKKASEAPKESKPPGQPRAVVVQPTLQPRVDQLIIGYVNMFSGFEQRSPIGDILKSKLAHYTGITNVVLVHALKHRNLVFDFLLSGVGSGKIRSLAQLNGHVKFLWAQEHVVRQGTHQGAIDRIPDFAVGYLRGVKSTSRTMRLPNWMFYWDFLYDDSKDLDQVLHTKPKLNGRKRRACFIARLRHDGSRVQMVKSLQSVIPTDCPGRVAHNTGGQSVEKITGINDRKKSKLVYIQNYLFNLCPENGSIPGYVTEKMMQACIAGCIPIYWGHQRMEPDIINPARVIRCQGKSNIGAQAKKQIGELLSDESKLRSFFDQPVFLPTARDSIVAIREDFNRLMAQASRQIMAKRP